MMVFLKYYLAVFLALVVAVRGAPTYRKDGTFVIGAILPLTTGANCDQPNRKGLGIAESIVYGVDRIGAESDFAELRTQKTIGYDIRDNCGQPDQTRNHVLDIAQEGLNYKGGNDTKAPDVIISAFRDEDSSSLSSLAGKEILAAVSYASDNARLSKTKANVQKPIDKLVSAYPEEKKKMIVVAEIVKEFGFNYVHGIADNDDEGKAAMDKLKAAVASAGTCMTALHEDVTSIVNKVKENRLIKVLVVHTTDEQKEKDLYTSLGNENITDLTIITTRGYEGTPATLQDVKKVVDGGLTIYYKRPEGGEFQRYMAGNTPPYTGRPWLQELFKSFNGPASCLSGSQPDVACNTATDGVRDVLTKDATEAEYAYNAALSIAYGLQETLKTDASGASLLETMKGLKVTLAVLMSHNIVFNQKLTATISKFYVGNMKIMAGGNVESKYSGLWDEDGDPLKLSLTKNQITWSEGSSVVPESVCSESCAPGSRREFNKGTEQCCWKCIECDNGTASNISNANQCNKCPQGTVVQPNKDGCKNYALLYFEWFGGPGAVVIVLMIIGVALVLFGLGVFSQNSQHELVIYSNYNSLCLFLLAILILIFAPVPLLVKIPTPESCGAYIIMFNVGVTIVLGIITSRSAYVNNLFDGNGELVRGSLGRFPRTTVVIVCTLIQVIVQIIAFNMEVIRTIHNETDAWDQRYHECSSWASSTFWAGFVVNVLISVVGNSMSCSSLDMEANAYELKYVLLSHLMFYLWGIVELVVFYRTNDQHLAGGQAIVCILLAISFFFCYAWPKIYAILFHSKGGKLIPGEDEDEDEERGVVTEAHAMHSSAGFRGQGIVAVKIREEDA